AHPLLYVVPSGARGGPLGLPLALEHLLELGAPLRMRAAVLTVCSITISIRSFDFVPRFDVRVLGLLPIAARGLSDALPCRCVIFGPPARMMEARSHEPLLGLELHCSVCAMARPRFVSPPLARVAERGIDNERDAEAHEPCIVVKALPHRRDLCGADLAE